MKVGDQILFLEVDENENITRHEAHISSMIDFKVTVAHKSRNITLHRRRLVPISRDRFALIQPA
ncbi:hypothetical protein [Sphingomonas sp. C3-2]|uniref:hypothetical protein n=1 Tax=Sphingomonas sp. C3-2 TaxID=3062169 RepID=UPI00294ACD7B|nr:hypothetical protein [Sphingomonas sp. C3-2]WOK37335.1 hypothetical protein QYC26_03860 [Sphingomonas sp. C3-2]